jgi:hypothetical protein
MASVLLTVHRIALERLLEIAERVAPGGKLHEELAADEVTGTLLLLHELERRRPPAVASLIPLERLTRGKNGETLSAPEADEPAEHESCELCGAPLAQVHEHLLEAATGELSCACAACAVTSVRLRVTPRCEVLPAFGLDDAEWLSLGLPIELAFFVGKGDPDEVVGYYPSPTGAVESKLPLDGWRVLARRWPELRTLAPHVEAVLVNRTDGKSECFLVSIDECFALVGLVRRHYRGISGGAELRERIASFFGELRARARPRLDVARGGRELEAACPS